MTETISIATPLPAPVGDRWDNYDHLTMEGKERLVAEYLDYVDTVKTAEDQLKVHMRTLAKQRKDARKQISGKTGLALGILDSAVKMGKKNQIEMQETSDQHMLAMMLVCKARGIPMPQVQYDMMALLENVRADDLDPEA